MVLLSDSGGGEREGEGEGRNCSPIIVWYRGRVCTEFKPHNLLLLHG